MLEQYFSKLQSEYKAHKRSAFLYIFWLIIVIASIFYKPKLALALLAFSVIFQIFYMRRKQKKYIANFNDANIRLTIADKIKTDEIHAKSGGYLTADKLRNVDLLPILENNKAVLLRQGINGNYRGLSVAIADVSFPHEFRLVKGGRRRIYFNSGVWVQFKLPQEQAQIWHFHDRNCIGTPIRQEFYKNKLEYYVHDLEPEGYEQSVLYLNVNSKPEKPSGKVLKLIEKLRRYCRVPLAISVVSDQVDVFLKQRFLTMPVSVAVPPSKEDLLLDPLPEIEYIYDIVKQIEEEILPTNSQ